MEARHCLLTHFSARYPKLPPLTRADGTARAFEPIVAIAFDLATLRLDEFWKMDRYREAMDLLFGWDEGEEEESIAGGESLMDIGGTDEGVTKESKRKQKEKGR